MEEMWKKIDGFDYEVSNFGNIRSIAREGTKGGLIKLCTNGKYYKVKLCNNGKYYQKYVHRLVAEYFIEKVDGKNEVNHINGNKLDNHCSNLEWCNRLENIKHAYDNGLRKTKIVGQFTKDGVLVNTYLNTHRASIECGVGYANIFNCLNGKKKTCKGYIWKYL